jgi:hypothetical protein
MVKTSISPKSFALEDGSFVNPHAKPGRTISNQWQLVSRLLALILITDTLVTDYLRFQRRGRVRIITWEARKTVR